jgi:hypothetical protein
MLGTCFALLRVASWIAFGFRLALGLRKVIHEKKRRLASPLLSVRLS